MTNKMTFYESVTVELWRYYHPTVSLSPPSGYLRRRGLQTNASKTRTETGLYWCGLQKTRERGPVNGHWL